MTVSARLVRIVDSEISRQMYRRGFEDCKRSFVGGSTGDAVRPTLAFAGLRHRSDTAYGVEAIVGCHVSAAERVLARWTGRAFEPGESLLSARLENFDPWGGRTYWFSDASTAEGSVEGMLDDVIAVSAQFWNRHRSMEQVLQELVFAGPTSIGESRELGAAAVLATLGREDEALESLDDWERRFLKSLGRVPEPFARAATIARTELVDGFDA